MSVPPASGHSASPEAHPAPGTTSSLAILLSPAPTLLGGCPPRSSLTRPHHRRFPVPCPRPSIRASVMLTASACSAVTRQAALAMTAPLPAGRQASGSSTTAPSFEAASASRGTVSTRQPAGLTSRSCRPAASPTSCRTDHISAIRHLATHVPLHPAQLGFFSVSAVASRACAPPGRAAPV